MGRGDVSASHRMSHITILLRVKACSRASGSFTRSGKACPDYPGSGETLAAITAWRCRRRLDDHRAVYAGDLRWATRPDRGGLGRRREYAIRRLHASSFLRLSRERHARRVGGSTAGKTRLEMTHKMGRAAGNTHVAAAGSFTRTRCAATTTPYTDPWWTQNAPSPRPV